MKIESGSNVARKANLAVLFICVFDLGLYVVQHSKSSDIGRTVAGL